MSEAESRAGRLDFLDGIRGVASLLVVVHHTIESQWSHYSSWAHSHIDLGRVGIVAFFLVSGYVVGLTLSSQSARTFTVRRFWRLYPIYWLATALWIAVWYAVGHDVPPEMTLWGALVNLTMLQGVIGMWSILNPAWTLGIEIAFYAQSVAAKIIDHLRWVAWSGYLWLAAFAALALSNATRGSAYSALVPLMLFTACVGFALYRWDTARDRSLWPLLIAAVVVVPILGAALGTNPQAGVWPPAGFNASYLGGLALFAAFWFARRSSLPRWLLGLGAESYSLYLVHLTVIQLVGQTVLWEIPAAGAVIAICLSVAAAAALHRWVERPSTRHGRSLTIKQPTTRRGMETSESAE